MDKYLKAIKLMEHPERFSPEEIRDLLTDPEIREIYDTLCASDTALKTPPQLSQERIDEEWDRFKREKSKPFHFTRWRAVAAALIAVPSLAALAIGFVVINRSESTSHDQRHEELHSASTAIVSPQEAPTVAPADTIRALNDPVVFENEKLGAMLETLSGHYRLRVEVVNTHALDIRLFFRWNPVDDASEVVRQLNNFDRISLKLNDNVLTVM